MPETVAQRLKEARLNAGFESASEAARAFGWTIATYGHHENGNRTPRLHAARKYAEAFGVSVNWLLTGKDRQELPDVITLNTIPVVSDVAAGVWLETTDMAFDEEIRIAAAPGWPSEQQKARRIKGNSVNKLAQDGEFVLCIPLEFYGQPKSGNLVIAQRTRGQLTEISAKRLEYTATGAELHPESTDPRHQSKIDLGDPTSDSIEILEIIVGAYRSFDQPK